MLSKKDQTKKSGKMKNSKKLSKAENLRFRMWLTENIKVCQICGLHSPQDAHHLFYGAYGADKDDKKQIAVCRLCHEQAHKNKKESQERYELVADENWNNCLSNKH